MTHRFDGFDPFKDIVTAPFAMPTGLKTINFRALTPFQRALLVADGTVTQLIESYTLEPVEIVTLDQNRELCEERHLWLETEETTAVIRREVIIRGKYSHTLYVYGVSHIVPERLPETIRRRLEIQGEGIGRLINDNALETRREILWFGTERPTQLPASIHHLEQEEFISRVYKIITCGKPIALINERFPTQTDQLPHHH